MDWPRLVVGNYYVWGPEGYRSTRPARGSDGPDLTGCPSFAFRWVSLAHHRITFWAPFGPQLVNLRAMTDPGPTKKALDSAYHQNSYAKCPFQSLSPGVETATCSSSNLGRLIASSSAALHLWWALNQPGPVDFNVRKGRLTGPDRAHLTSGSGWRRKSKP